MPRKSVWYSETRRPVEIKMGEIKKGGGVLRTSPLAHYMTIAK